MLSQVNILILICSGDLLENIPVYALSGIMGNHDKIAEKQSGKIYVYPHISILRFIFERKLIL